MNKRFPWILGLIALSVTCQLSAQVINVLEDIRLLPKDGNLSVILDLKKEAQYTLQKTPDERKITLNLKSMQAKPGLQKKLAKLHLNHISTKSISLINDKTTTKVTLVLRSAQVIKVRRLPPQGSRKHRLIIELSPKASQAKPIQATLKVLPQTRRIPLKSIDPSKKFVIAVDAGHGGSDPGAIGARGTMEKMITLAVAKHLAHLINVEPNFRAILTRSGDYYLGLQQRVEVARLHKADLFISIHADAFHNRAAQGASIFTLSSHGATNAAAKWLAERENRSDLIGGLQLKGKNKLLDSVLLDLSQVASQKASQEAASHILKSLSRVVPLHRTHVDQAGFAVLKAPDIPSLLIETGFLTNTVSEARLNNPWHQKQLAQAVLHGVRTYFDGKLGPTTITSTGQNAKSNSTVARLPSESNRSRRGR